MEDWKTSSKMRLWCDHVKRLESDMVLCEDGLDIDFTFEEKDKKGCVNIIGQNV